MLLSFGALETSIISVCVVLLVSGSFGGTFCTLGHCWIFPRIIGTRIDHQMDLLT